MKLRALLVWLVCMNIGTALWWCLHTPAPANATPAIVPGVAMLRLLLNDPAPAPAASARCLSIGPFFQRDTLRTAMHGLSTRAQRLQIRELPGAELIGYRVYLPASSSRAGALAIASELRARGIRDYYVMNVGAQKNAIALGMYPDLVSAEQRRAELKARGVSALLEPRSDHRTQWWIDAVIAPDVDWQVPLAGMRGVQARPMVCLGVAAVAPTAAPELPDSATTR